MVLDKTLSEYKVNYDKKSSKSFELYCRAANLVVHRQLNVGNHHLMSITRFLAQIVSRHKPLARLVLDKSVVIRCFQYAVTLVVSQRH